MTIIPFCASTVFLNVINLYLYFSNSVLIVLYVCDDGILFFRCIVHYKSSSDRIAAALQTQWKCVDGGFESKGLPIPHEHSGDR